MDEAGARAVKSAHAPTLANTYYLQALLEILRDDAEAARRAAEACVALSREHGLALYLALGALTLAWARAKLGDRDSGSAEFRQALAEYASQGNKFLPFFRGLLAEIEAERGDAEAALAGIDGALALAGETGEHWFDAGLHRIRGEILLKQNPADPAPAEAAFLAAIAVAQQQKARSFGLRAALSLAKLYQSTARPVDAHDVLAPALEGFSPTPELPQIAEAKALFEALAGDQTNESRSGAAARKAEIADQLRPGDGLVERLRRRGDQGGPRANPEARGPERQCRRAHEGALRAMGRFVHGRRTQSRPTRRPKASSARRNWRATPPPPRPPRGLWDRLASFKAGSRRLANICARRYVFIVRAGRPPPAACMGLTLGSRQGLSRHGRLARRRCDRRRGSIRGSVDRGARFRTRAHDCE